MTKTVMHLVYSFGCGGLEKVIVNLVNHSRNYPVTHIVVSLTDELEFASLLPEGTQVYQLDKKAGNDLQSHYKLYKLLKKIKPDVINTYNFGTLEYHLTAKLAGVPLQIHSDHGRGGDDPDGKNKLHNLFRRHIAKLLSNYIVVSFDLYNWVKSDIQVSEHKLSLLFNGVDINHNAALKPEKPTSFITIGRLHPIKNQALLIKAFSRAIDQYPEFQASTLDIVGDGIMYDELQALIKKLDKSKQIRLLGLHNDIADKLAHADAFLLSSDYEAMPMTILEAMANKRPVISTAVGGISRFINDEHAWFVEAGNEQAYAETLAEFVQQDEQRNQKAITAFNLVNKQYSIDKMVHEYLTLYQVEI